MTEEHRSSGETYFKIEIYALSYRLVTATVMLNVNSYPSGFISMLAQRLMINHSTMIQLIVQRFKFSNGR